MSTLAADKPHSVKVLLQARDEARRLFGGPGKVVSAKDILLKEFNKRHWFIDSIATIFKNSM
jgi:hypothetical protein